MAEASECLTAVELQGLIDGTLPILRQTSAEAHLESCDTCRRSLEALADQGDLIPPRVAAAASATRSMALEDAMRKLKSDTDDPEETLETDSHAPSWFPKLGHSDDPRSLGRLGTYEILEVVGRGGMGTVFKARDQRLDRLVAVKVLNPDLSASGAARQRFLQEARSAAAVTHDHVVTIHAVDEAGGAPFLVMEYILGVSLADRIGRSGHLRVEEILRIGMQAASGLAAAHAQGIVHRDIKPANILLENGVERVKLSDFGLARVVHEAQMTNSGAVAGTPEYMSPEQACGEPVDHRSDLFSLGCVMYAMCVGRSPFRADTAQGAMHRVREHTARPIQATNPDIPDWLVAIINRLLEKKPEDRFQSAAELADVLEGYLAHVQQPSRVALPRLQPASQQWSSRFRSTFPVVISVVTIFVLALVSWWILVELRSTGPVDFYAVSLESYATRTRSEPTDGNLVANNLAALPEELIVNGIPFQIPHEYIQLAGETQPGWPTEVKGIAVGTKAAKLHFLHGCARGNVGFGKTVAVYVLHYDDGSSAELPMITGRHVWNWWAPAGSIVHTTQAITAWTGTNPVASARGQQIQVFACSYENPHPEKTISTIDFLSGTPTHPYPFCLAITCDDDAAPLRPESGLLTVYTSQFGVRYSLAIPGQTAQPIQPRGRHDFLLPPGRYPIELYLNNVLLRSGSVAIESGGRVSINLAGGSAALFPLPYAQPETTTDLRGQMASIWDVAFNGPRQTLATAAENGSVLLWKKVGDSWECHTILQDCSSGIRSAAFSLDGRSLATVAASGAIRVWDVNTGTIVATLKDGVGDVDNADVRLIEYSSTGSIVSGNGDGTIDFWDVEKREKTVSIRAHSKQIVGIAFSADGSMMATGARDENIVKVWDVTAKEVRHILFGHTDSVAAVAFSFDGQLLASVSDDGTAKLWSTVHGEQLASYSTPFALKTLAFSPDGTRLAAAGHFQTIHIWDLTEHRLLHEFQAHWGRIRSLFFSDNGTMLISRGEDNAVRQWRISDLPGPFPRSRQGPNPRTTFVVHDRWSFWSAFSQNPNLVAGVSVAPNIRVWNLADFTFAARFPVHVNEGADSFGYLHRNSLLFTPDEKLMLTCVTFNNKPPGLELWETTNFKRHGVVAVTAEPVVQSDFGARVLLTDSGKTLLLVSPRQELVRASSLSTGETYWVIPPKHGRFGPATVSSDGGILALGTELGLVVMIDTKTGDEIHPPLTHGDAPVLSVEFSPDGASFVSTCKNGVVKIWDGSTFESRALNPIHKEKVHCAAFSPDGSLLVTTGGAWMNDEAPWTHTGEIFLWDVATWTLMWRFESHYGSVTSAVFSPDGRNLATTGRDGKLHLWDVEELLRYAQQDVDKERRTNSVSGHSGDD